MGLEGRHSDLMGGFYQQNRKEVFMVAVKSKQSQLEAEESSSFIQEGALLTVSGTALDVVGKLTLAIGTTGLLLYAFSMIEALLGLGVIYSGAAVVAVGLVTAALSSKLRTGSWFKGIFA